MRYRVKKLESPDRRTLYVPQVHLFLFLWTNINKDSEVTGSIFYPEFIDTDSIYNACFSLDSANKAIEAHQKYYKAVKPCPYTSKTINDREQNGRR